MSWLRWFGIVADLLAVYGAMCGIDRLERWADRRRWSRRTALDRRRRARTAHATAIGRDEFRQRTRGYLLELRERDDVAAIVAGVEYVQRASSEPRDAA